MKKQVLYYDTTTKSKYKLKLIIYMKKQALC